jgi:orotidine-5'-phosphate decarboxylase
MVRNNTLVCVGLDPDLKKMPIEITGQNISNEEKIYQFLRGVIDVTASNVCAYKAQKAFFDILPGGHDLLKELIAYLHKTYPELPVILDCKIGDIDNTMSAYIENIFGILNADGVVINPYMGDDAVMPFAEISEKAVVVLVNSSNPSGALIQNVKLPNGFMLWKHVLELVVDRWNYNQNMIPVLSANSTDDMSLVRPFIPDQMPILLAGVGAQGGNYTNLRHLLNTNKLGVFVNSSRGILYSTEGQKSWQSAVAFSALRLKSELNKEGGRIE